MIRLHVLYEWWGALFRPEGSWLAAAMLLFPCWIAWCRLVAVDAGDGWLSERRHAWHLRSCWLSILFVWLMIVEHGRISFALFIGLLVGFAVCLMSGLLSVLADMLARLTWRLT